LLIWLHWSGKIERQRQTDPSFSGATLSGKDGGESPPAMAPGSMIQLDRWVWRTPTCAAVAARPLQPAARMPQPITDAERHRQYTFRTPWTGQRGAGMAATQRTSRSFPATLRTTWQNQRTSDELNQAITDLVSACALRPAYAGAHAARPDLGRRLSLFRAGAIYTAMQPPHSLPPVSVRPARSRPTICRG
jgi:hypothetical protein